MRKRTVSHIAITVFWYVLYFLPVIAYLLFLFIHPGSISTVSPIPFEQFISDIGFTVLTDNIVITSLKQIFGVGGIIPFIESNSIYIILSWYVGVFFMHLFIDVLLFIPKWAHCQMQKYEKGE